MKATSNKILDRYFAFLEKRKMSDLIIFHAVLITVIATALTALIEFNQTYITSVPTSGGTLVEGIVGTPRFVNPVLAITRADHDISALVYSGLVRIDESGELVNDLAEKIEVSEDKRTYHITVKDGLRFHDGSALTARDVAFTIELIQNADLKSPLRGAWEGVIVEELGDRELNIILEEPYAPFVENLTVGILPRTIWGELPIEQLPFSQHNTEPIGSGPYMVVDSLRNKSGLINAYKLQAFAEANREPNITTIVFNFYLNEDELMQALEQGEIAGTPSLTTEQLAALDSDDFKIIETPLPRTFAVYFNQNKSPALRDRFVREALEASINRDALVTEVLGGHGIPISSPIPTGFLTLQSTSTSATNTTADPVAILQSGGWQRNDEGVWQKNIDDDTVSLAITLTTSNTPLFEATAQYLAASWEALGVDVQIDQFEQADLVQGIIRPRDFEALLFGADVGRTVDLYPFWHSSQKDDPGLNIAQYTNISADRLLSDLRDTTDVNEKSNLAKEFVTTIESDTPALFLFVPNFTYVIDNDVVLAPFTKLGKPSERFANVADWHITSSDLWPIFSH